MVMMGIGCTGSENKATNPQTQAAPSNSPATTVTPTATTVETKTYEDQQWLNAVTIDSSASGDLLTDLTNVQNACTNVETTGINLVGESAGKLYLSSEAAYKHSNSYDVSQDLQPAKDEYNLGLTEVNTIAVKLARAVDSYNKGDLDQYETEMSAVKSHINSTSEHFSKATSLIKAYREKNSTE